MEKRFGHMTVPAPGFGTWPMRAAECEQAVRAALEVGYRHIDTAQMYRNEDAVGRALAGSGLSREEVFITSKVANQNHAPADVFRSVEESLRQLGTDHLDLLLIHWPVPGVPLEETLAAMFDLAARGSVLHVGVSNFDHELVEAALEVGPIRCNQVEHHPFLQREELRRQAVEHEMMLTAYSPLAEGEAVRHPTIRAIAEERGVPPSAVVIRWLLDQPNVVPIPKASRTPHIEENWSATTLELSEEDRGRIDALDEAGRPRGRQR